MFKGFLFIVVINLIIDRECRVKVCVRDVYESYFDIYLMYWENELEK